MPIDVTCPGCHTRFKVSDKFAGQEGPCPKCKHKIRVPKLEEQVVVHAPESFGPKTKSGQAVLKPIQRRETKVQGKTWALIAAVFVIIVGGALWLRDPEQGQPLWALALGSILVAFPVARTGYAFLRDDELDPYRGKELWIRVSIVSLLYAATWAALTWLPPLAGFETLGLMSATLVVGLLLAFGTAVAYFALDLETGPAFFHYAYYLGVTIGLRLIMALPPLSVPIETTT